MAIVLAVCCLIARAFTPVVHKIDKVGLEIIPTLTPKQTKSILCNHAHKVSQRFWDGLARGEPKNATIRSRHNSFMQIVYKYTNQHTNIPIKCIKTQNQSVQYTTQCLCSCWYWYKCIDCIGIGYSVFSRFCVVVLLACYLCYGMFYTLFYIPACHPPWRRRHDQGVLRACETGPARGIYQSFTPAA